MSHNVTKASEKAVPVVGQSREVNPKAVILNASGFGWREWMVRFPEGSTADALKEPSIWSRVQARREISFRRHDRVYVVAFDETWVAEAIVADATASSVTLARPRITQFEPRTVGLFQDDRYKIEWNGLAYQVMRKSDGQVMADGLANEAIAEKALRDLYPRAVA